MVRNMILLVHDCCMWPRTHPGCPVIHQKVSRVIGKALKIFATIVTVTTIVHWLTKGGGGLANAETTETCLKRDFKEYIKLLDFADFAVQAANSRIGPFAS